MNNLSNNEYQYISAFVNSQTKLNEIFSYGEIFFINFLRLYLNKQIEIINSQLLHSIEEVNRYITDRKKYPEFINEGIIHYYKYSDSLRIKKYNYELLLNNISAINFKKSDIDNPLFYGAKIKVEKEE